jgi:integrase
MVKIRPYTKRGAKGWEVDIIVRLPNGETVRERVKSPVSSASGTKAWAAAREAFILRDGSREKKTPAPTLAEFWPDYVKGHVIANRQKPSTQVTTESIYRTHLGPAFGALRLDAINDERIQAFKGGLSERSPKTVNNILTVLGKALRTAVKWGKIPRLPCALDLVKYQRPKVDFYEPEVYERLLEGARKADERTHLLALLGGDAGLRIGEAIALEWTDLDFRRASMKIQRSEWQGSVTAPKGGQSRDVPMTARLAAMLQAQRNLRTRVLTKDDGTGIDWHWAREKMATAQRRAGMEPDGKLHKLRHTFGARLATKGAVAKVIQEIMGHADLATTMRYLHLAKGATAEAIRLLESGDVVETGPTMTLAAGAGHEKAPESGRDSEAKMVTRTGLEPMLSA